ncbi:Acetylcholine receptor subunit beta-type lev-1 [Caenorhabditis elegans]|uniref:Acetylcholine receptor subunit beta-type lev-1 n=1 Tax=Caenorhabditis elegans TaxID=6239 RepID=ACH7_CAEEL|nr:Acetylcholine receptor subunit beta-type lev-1 [Caenorhabditis elegans]Q27218.1 RecName: Full=Acetylcholine receptor subunit beta-type lev-1; AltName: Full=Levamisole-resistant protein 1; Flags: Precursor [Caenorhabditis elegans]CAA66902.1 nicotinic acetylcholine receptor [Caenorhabditis elegans]CAA67198.1 non-alpha nicotinic acetylcholine receptor subunit [Caenorhabditis elegans]CAB03148.2 Acetylcholine receptor subunit beta-type lev-1 [Caenorhabditis elegans]|eukprot:NP_001255705.1 Acetylcholine receptor subunit beta-type lev-1 [Caenorhabditis elegans]
MMLGGGGGCGAGGTWLGFLVFLAVSLRNHSTCEDIDAEDRLMVDLFRGYNSLVQPVRNRSELPMIVKIGMQLVLLINVDEKEQVMHTNVWLTMKWDDFQLKWDPRDYANITQIRVAPEKVWLPDIVLFNNADGNYEVSFMCNVLILSTGTVLWVPPAIYKSSCIIDVEFFPFDDQLCSLTFGSWTYNRDEIKLDFLTSDRVDFSEYSTSSIWDMMDGPAVLTSDRSRIEFQIRIRRKTLFYTVVLILPTVLMAFLNVTVFYLPTASGEKMGLTMNVLLSIVVFLLLVSKILPPTSSSIPLVAKYLLLTFVLNIITIMVTTIICNIYFRSPITHRLPPWVRKVFLDILPLLMCMQRPHRKNVIQRSHRRLLETGPSVEENPMRSGEHHPLCRHTHNQDSCRRVRIQSDELDDELSPEAQRAIDAIEFITENRRDEEITKQFRDDWKFIASVVDRFLLYGFFGATVGGTIGIIFTAPSVFETFDENATLVKLKQLYDMGLANDTVLGIF